MFVVANSLLFGFLITLPLRFFTVPWCSGSCLAFAPLVNVEKSKRLVLCEKGKRIKYRNCRNSLIHIVHPAEQRGAENCVREKGFKRP